MAGVEDGSEIGTGGSFGTGISAPRLTAAEETLGSHSKLWVTRFAGLCILTYYVIMYFLRSLRSWWRDSARDKDLEKYDNISFSEWEKLPFETKRDIWNHRWNPWRPDVGLATRRAIVQAFREGYPGLSEAALAIGIDWFGWDVPCLYVVVHDSSMRVPQEFSDLYVNKGILRQRIDDDNLVVDWRYGSSKSPFRISAWEPDSGDNS